MLKIITVMLCGLCAGAVGAEDLGQLSANPYGPNSTANPYSPAGSPYSSTSVKNPYGQYGSPYSPKSATNPYATDAPKLYDAQGEYRGKLSANPYDPDSVSNPYGRYGSPYSSESINNTYGAGNPYDSDSPTNPYGTGWTIKSGDDSPPKPPSYTPSVPAVAQPKRSICETATSASAWCHMQRVNTLAADPWEVLTDPEGDQDSVDD